MHFLSVYPLKKISLRKACCAALIACLVIPSAPWVFAQQNEEDRDPLAFTIGQTVAWSDNPDLERGSSDSGFYSRTSVTFGMEKSTSRDRFEMGFIGNFDAGDVLDNTGLVDSTLRLRYTREAANSRLNAYGFFRSFDLNDRNTTLAEDTNGDGITNTLTPITLSRGTRDFYRAGAGFETGLQSPIGLAFNVNRSERHYTDTTDSDLFDRDNTTVGARVSFRIDPRITLRANARYNEYNAEDDEQTERDTTRLTLGGSFLAGQRTTVELDIGSERVVTDDIDGRDVEEGLALDFGVIQQMQNGTLTARALSGVDQNGRFDSIRIIRALTTSSDADLSFSAGVGRVNDGSSVDPLYGFSYARDFQTSRATVNLTQEIRSDGGDNDDTELLDTQLRANYARELNRTMRMIVEVDMRDEETISGTLDDRRRIRFGVGLNGQINPVSSWGARVDYVTTNIDDDEGSSEEDDYVLDLSYRRLLSNDVALVASYEYVLRENSDRDDDAEGNTMSLTLEKTFGIRP